MKRVSMAVFILVAGLAVGCSTSEPTRAELLDELGTLGDAEPSAEFAASWAADYLASDPLPLADRDDDGYAGGDKGAGPAHFEVPPGQSPPSDPGTGPRPTRQADKCNSRSKPTKQPKPDKNESKPDDTSSGPSTFPRRDRNDGTVDTSPDAPRTGRPTARVSCCNYKTCYSTCRKAKNERGFDLSACLSRCDRDFNHCPPIP